MRLKNSFVFVACGDNSHIKTLHYSLRYLKHFSNCDILVVTDLRRNAISIEHDNVIDIETPVELNNHEASIFLKTSLHTILNLEGDYCYLDTDVVAVDFSVDEIFTHQTGPVSFSPDHFNIKKFSPHAVNCGCLKRSLENQKKLEDLEHKYFPSVENKGPEFKEKAVELQRVFRTVYGDPLSHLPLIAKSLFSKYISPTRYFHLTEKYKLDKTENVWLDNENNVILYDTLKYHRKIEDDSEFRFNRVSNQWLDGNGNDVYKIECNHLMERMEEVFDVSLTDSNWVHWNGGVFLFNKDSIPFMDYWHSSTMKILKDKQWATRDQGTLSLAAWKFNLQNQKTLPVEFNFLADYQNEQLTFTEGEGFTYNGSNTYVQPHFIHVFHHFGDPKWNVWNYINSLLPS